MNPTRAKENTRSMVAIAATFTADGLEPALRFMLAEAGIAAAPEAACAAVEDAVKAAEGFGFPVVMKIVSPDILHKTEAGGVRLGVSDMAALRDAYGGSWEAFLDDLRSRPAMSNTDDGTKPTSARQARSWLAACSTHSTPCRASDSDDRSGQAIGSISAVPAPRRRSCTR